MHGKDEVLFLRLRDPVGGQGTGMSALPAK